MAETTPTTQQAPAAAPLGKPPVPQETLKNADAPRRPQSAADTYPVGIAGEQIEQVERKVAPGEPPPWPVNEKLAVVGKPTPRVDGRLKVTGAAKYTADVKLPGMLYARLITSPHPAARIRKIDASAAEKNPRVKAVHFLDPDLTLRYVGQPIGAVAAITQADADEAARAVRIDYEILPFVVDEAKAQEPKAPLIFAEKVVQKATAGGGGGGGGEKHGNVQGPAEQKRGDVEAALKSAEVVIEAEYRTQVQTHSALETHGVVADYKPQMLTVYASTQGTESVRDDLANVFKLPKGQVRVITEFMGGGFGAKFGAGSYGALATHLSKKAGAPVRLMLDRREEHLCVGNRPSSRQKVLIGAKKDGTLVALSNVNHGSAGVGTGAGATGPWQNLYKCENLLTQDYDVFINAGPAAAFRAPGHPQGAFSLECAMDELAEKLGMDPLELREKNDPSDARRVERKIGAEKIGWAKRQKAGADQGAVKRGIGMAQAVWYRMNNKDSHAEVRINRDGSVEVLSSVQDIGGGIRTALAQVVAEELGLKPGDITVKIGDTNYPHGPASGGSVTTNSITPPARDAAFKVKQTLLKQLAPAMGTSPEELQLVNGKLAGGGKSMSFKEACKKLQTDQISEKASRQDDFSSQPRGSRRRRGEGSDGAGGVQFVQVAVDTGTGQVTVERVVAVHDCGRPINPLATQSQIDGGVIQGLSYALYENRILDEHKGAMVNSNLEQYKILGPKDMPEIESVVIEQYWGRSSTDAGPIGEPATVPTAAAVANAIYNAIGVRIRELPITPGAILAALAAKGGAA